MTVWTAAETVVEDADDIDVQAALTSRFFATIRFGELGLSGRILLTREAAVALHDGLAGLVFHGPDDGSDDLYNRRMGK